jgi:uncharacterized protein YjiS (DUF1127 family)
METKMNRSLATFLSGFSLRELAIRLFDRLLAWQARAQEAEQMRAMDDRQLKDIGLSRADIERILNSGSRHI